MNLTGSQKKLILAGGIFGVIAAFLAYYGNPQNMAICVACYIRDTSGAMYFHTNPLLQYVRPEITGFVMGALIISLVTKEYRSTGGSAPMVRFVLGMIIMFGSLVFLGCPLRMVLRMSAGDLNAYIALIGFIGGVGTGVVMLKRRFSLGRSYETSPMSGFVLPFILVFILLLSVTTNLFAVSEDGPGSQYAPVLISLIGAIIFGIIAQRSRLCFAGGIRDVILLKNFDLLITIGGLFVVFLVYNLISGDFNFGMQGHDVAHTEVLWNILGMYVVGFAAVLAGGCPLRQLILTGQGSSDAAVTFLGMFVGAALSHNFAIASTGQGTTPAGRIVVIGCIIVLFVIGIFNKRKATI